MATERTQIQDWLRLIQTEYEEFPDLQLTRSQIEELWELETTVAEALLAALVSAGVLTLTSEGSYVRQRPDLRVESETRLRARIGGIAHS